MRSGRERVLTVRIAPAMINPKLNVCWLVLATFSPFDSWPHGTCPVSLKGVTALFRVAGSGRPVVPSPVCVCVAYVLAATSGLMLAGGLANAELLIAGNIVNSGILRMNVCSSIAVRG